MSDQKLGRLAVQSAIDGALESLSENEALSWVRKSRLFVHAYYLGLHQGLSTIAEEDCEGVLTKMLVHVLSQTLWPRRVDDSFHLTTIGRCFEEINRKLTSADSDFSIRDLLRELDYRISEQEHRFGEVIRDARRVLERVRELSDEFATKEGQADELGKEQCRAEMLGLSNSRLEEPLRQIALLETDHRIGWRFET